MSQKKEFIKHAVRGGGIVSFVVFSQFVVGFVVQVVLAKNLSPNDFGIVAFAATVGLFFNGLTNTLGEQYLVQSKKEATALLDNIFTLEFLLAVLFFLLLSLLGPVVLELFGKTESYFIALVLAFSYFYNPLNKPRAIFERNLDFGRAKLPLVAAQVLSGVIAVFLSYRGFGLWSLVFWRVSVLFFECIILWCIASYRPKIRLEWHVVKDVFGYGWPLMLASMMLFFNQNISYYIFSVLDFGDELSGYYWLAFQFSLYFLRVRQIVQSVLFPVFSRVLDSNNKKILFQKLTVTTSSILMVPVVIAVFFGLDIILFLFGQKWVPSVFPFQVIFITIMIRGINANLGYYFQSEGVTTIPMVTGVGIMLLLPPLGYFLSKHFGINGMSIAVLVVDILITIYIYKRFVVPRVGHGFVYFFGKPLSVALGALLLERLVLLYDVGIWGRLGLFLILMVVVYYVSLRATIMGLLSDLKEYRKV